jgi:hypothetical protein
LRKNKNYGNLKQDKIEKWVSFSRIFLKLRESTKSMDKELFVNRLKALSVNKGAYSYQDARRLSITLSTRGDITLEKISNDDEINKSD